MNEVARNCRIAFSSRSPFLLVFSRSDALMSFIAHLSSGCNASANTMSASRIIISVLYALQATKSAWPPSEVLLQKLLDFCCLSAITVSNPFALLIRQTKTTQLLHSLWIHSSMKSNVDGRINRGEMEHERRWLDEVNATSSSCFKCSAHKTYQSIDRATERAEKWRNTGKQTPIHHREQAFTWRPQSRLSARSQTRTRTRTRLNGSRRECVALEPRKHPK